MKTGLAVTREMKSRYGHLGKLGGQKTDLLRNIYLLGMTMLRFAHIWRTKTSSYSNHMKARIFTIDKTDACATLNNLP